MTILFIEDNPDFSKYIIDLLVNHGYKVDLIETADEAVNILPHIAGRYNLIILDIMIRLGSIIKEDEASETGIAIYKRLRAINKDVKVLVLSALSKADIWSAFSRDSKAYYFGKPMPKDTSDFLKIIRGF